VKPAAGPAPESDRAKRPFDARHFRNALGRFASGVTVVTTRDSERVHGMTANAFVSVSLDPPLILISVDNRAAMNTLLPTTRYFGISVLAEGQDALSNHFAGRLQEGLDVPFVEKHDVPVIEGAVAHFVARVVDVHPAGDHTLYVGHVEYYEFADHKPLLFHGGRYHRLHEEKG
jgi:flavin reductase (DIM6/NTAB) family NADH-FMN oxidoreductase RutF